MNVSTEGGLRYLKPRMTGIDPPLLRLARDVVPPDSVVWDIGANLGLFAFAAASAAGRRGRVLAIEPDSLLVRMLRRSAELNRKLGNVEVLPAAASDRVGVGRFNIARRNRCTSFLEGFGTTQTGGVRDVELVPTVTLDWLAEHFPVPDVVKIDVEGAELLVLRGADMILEKNPVLICEVADRNSAEVSSILQSRGYELFDGAQPGKARRPLDLAPYSLLAIPSS